MAIAVAMKSQDGQYSNEFADNICSFYNFWELYVSCILDLDPGYPLN